MVIKNLENKIKLVTILCSMFLVGCIVVYNTPRYSDNRLG